MSTYQQIWDTYKKDFYKKNPKLPRKRAFSLGRALWAITREKGIQYLEFAKKTGLKGLSEKAIRNLCLDYDRTIDQERLQLFIKTLEVTQEEFFEAAQEEFFGNFFITKSKMPNKEDIEGYSQRGIFFHPQTIYNYPESSPNFKVIIHTPPIESLVDFFTATFLLLPGKSITGLQLPQSTLIQIHVKNSDLEIRLASHSQPIKIRPNQPIQFNSSIPHSFTNLSNFREIEFTLSFGPTQIFSLDSEKFNGNSSEETLTISSIVKKAQKIQSEILGYPVSLRDLALQSGLRANELEPLTCLSRPYINFPVDKLERIAELINFPLWKLCSPKFLSPNPDYEIFTSNDEGICDYRKNTGISFAPWVKMGHNKKGLFIGKAAFDRVIPKEEKDEENEETITDNDVLKDKRGDFKKDKYPNQKSWNGKNRGFLLAKQLEGRVAVHVGQRHHYPNICSEDTIYFDMELGFSLRNFSPNQKTAFQMIASMNFL